MVPCIVSLWWSLQHIDEDGGEVDHSQKHSIVNHMRQGKYLAQQGCCKVFFAAFGGGEKRNKWGQFARSRRTPPPARRLPPPGPPLGRRYAQRCNSPACLAPLSPCPAPRTGRESRRQEPEERNTEKPCLDKVYVSKICS